MLDSYIATVERFYLVLRRQGVTLSPQDTSLIEKWQSSNVPVEVVCKALVIGAQRYREVHGHDARLPSSIRYFQKVVEEVVEDARENVPLPDEPIQKASAAVPLSDDLAELAWIGKAETDPNRRHAYRNAWRALRNADSSDRLAALQHADQVAVDSMLETLPETEQRSIHSEVTSKLQALNPNLSPRGRKLRYRALLEDTVCERYGLVRLIRDLVNK